MTDITDIYNFKNFILNPARRELKSADGIIEIEPRAFDVLLYLVQNRDRAVDKNELQDAIWPGVIITETALTRAVMKARKAIGDDASRQEMIKTLHGHGYRFVAELSLEESTEPVISDRGFSSPTASESEAESDKPTPSLRTIILIAITIVVIAGLGWLLLRPQTSLGEEARMAVLPLLDNTDNPELAWTSLGLMSYTSKLIDSDGSIPVVPAGSIIGLAENFGWTGDLADPANEELLSKLVRIYGATHILAMELESEGVALRMNYALLEPEGDKRMGTIVGDDGTDLAQGVVQAMYGAMFRRSHIGGDIPLVSRDSFNNEAFARGMDLSLQGRCAEAMQFFRVIIEQEPYLFAPRYELAACLRILGQQQEAEELLTTLIDEQRPLGASRQLAETLMVLGILYNRTGRLDLSEQVYREALEISGETGEHVLRARVLQNLSIVFKSRSELDEAARLLDLALLAYEDAGLETLPGHLYSGRANLSMARGELVEAETELEQALQAFRSVGDRRSEAMILNNTGYLRRRQGRVQEAEAYHLRSLEIREEIGDRVGVGRIYSMLSGVYSAQGQYAKAISTAISALGIARETNDRLFEATSLAQLANAENSIGNVEYARAHYLEGRAIFVEIQDPLRTLQTDLKIARMDLRNDQFERVEAMAREILDTSRESDILSSEIEALELLGDMTSKQGNTGQAISWYQEALIELRDSTWASKENTLKVKLANAYLDMDEPGLAAPLVGALAGGPRNVPSLKTRARYAHVRGDSANAVNLMTQAKELAGKVWSANSETLLEEYRKGLQRAES